MFARITAVFGERDNALVVPEEAIVPQAGRQFVISVTPNVCDAAIRDEFCLDAFCAMRRACRPVRRRWPRADGEGAVCDGRALRISGRLRAGKAYPQFG